MQIAPKQPQEQPQTTTLSPHQVLHSPKTWSMCWTEPSRYRSDHQVSLATLPSYSPEPCPRRTPRHYWSYSHPSINPSPRGQGWEPTYKTLGCTTLALLKKMSSPFFVTLMVVFRNDSSTIPSRMRSRYNGCLRTWDLASLLASILPGLCLDQHSPNQPRQLRLIELLLRIPRRFKRLVARPQARHITSRVNRVVCSRVSQRSAQRLERAQFIHRRCAVFGELEDPVCP